MKKKRKKLLKWLVSRAEVSQQEVVAATAEAARDIAADGVDIFWSESETTFTVECEEGDCGRQDCDACKN